MNFFFYPFPTPGYDNSLEGLSFLQNKIPYLKIEQNSKDYIIYFHGNGEDIGYSENFTRIISNQLEMNLIALEYPKYGLYDSKEKPCQELIERDADLLIQDLINRLKINLQNIIIFGRSLGTGPACYLASKYKVKCLIIMSAYTSLKNVAIEKFNCIARFLVQEQFKNIERAKQIKIPTLLIHGQQDTLILVKHSQQIYDALSSQIKQQHYPPQMTHNEFKIDQDIIMPIQNFLAKIPGQLGYEQQKNQKSNQEEAKQQKL